MAKKRTKQEQNEALKVAIERVRTAYQESWDTTRPREYGHPNHSPVARHGVCIICGNPIPECIEMYGGGEIIDITD